MGCIPFGGVFDLMPGGRPLVENWALTKGKLRGIEAGVEKNSKK